MRTGFIVLTVKNRIVENGARGEEEVYKIIKRASRSRNKRRGEKPARAAVLYYSNLSNIFIDCGLLGPTPIITAFFISLFVY